MSARKCKFCGHEYYEPCDGEPVCPNYEHAKRIKEREHGREEAQLDRA